MKNKTIKIIFCIAAIILIVGIAMILIYPKKSIHFEDYFLNEQTDFLTKEKNSYQITKEDTIENYTRKATFLKREGQATFIREKTNHSFVNNQFETTLNTENTEEDVREKGEQFLEEIKAYLNYDGPYEINTTQKKEGEIDPTEWMFRSLLDDKINIHYSFYVDKKIFEYTLTKKDQTIHAIIKYNGLLG